MLDKLAGYKTQIRSLEKKLKEMDHTKLNPAKVKELTEAIQNLKNIVKEKEDKREERKRKKEEAAKAEPAEAPKAEVTVTTPEVVKESAFPVCKCPTPGIHLPGCPEGDVKKEADVNKFAIDSHVEPVRGTPGSWGTVIREAGVNGDPLVYVKWNEGTLKEAHGEYGAYYPSDLKLKAEVVVEAKDPTAYVPREQLYNLEADLKSNYEGMITDMQEEIKMAQEKGEYAWVGRLEEKLVDIQKAYQERFEKTATFADLNEADKTQPEKALEYYRWQLEHAPEGEGKMYLQVKINKLLEWLGGESKTAEDENGSGGTNKLKVVDQNPPYDKDPQEKSIGYGGDRPMGAMVAPNGQDNSLPLESSLNKDAKHTLNIKSLDDAMAECSEGDWHFSGTGARTKEELEEQFKKHTHKEASLKFAGLDLNSIEKRWALYVDGKLAIRTLTRQKAERVAKERFPEQVAAGKYEIKREDHVPVEAALDKEAINITVAEKLFVVNPLAKTIENEYVYDVNLANGSKLFKITSADEMGQEHLAYVIEKELLNHKEAVQKDAKNKCAVCGLEFNTWSEYEAHKKEKHEPKMAKLTSNLAFLKKGSFVSILDIDTSKKQIKFASLDNSLRGWAPMQKFAAMDVPSANLIDHEGHKDEILAESGHELLVSCPANSTNIIWREVVAPPATPESLNPDVASLKEARGCDQCNAAMINGVFCHETSCPNQRKQRDLDDEPGYIEDEASLNKDAHIRHEDGKWVIYSHDYKKKLGTYDSEAEAQKRLKQIEYFKHQGSLNPLSKKEAGQYDDFANKSVYKEQLEHFKKQLEKAPTEEIKKHFEEKVKKYQDLLDKKADLQDTKCEECGKELGPEVFLSKWPVCGKCTRKRHEKALGKHKKADQDISLEQQVQSFKDRMSAVTERLANPPAKTADLETTQNLSNVEVKDLSDAILHLIDMIESKVGEDVSADPELHPMLEDLENKVWEVELKLGIRPEIPEHESLEPEHKQIVEEVKQEEGPVEKEADTANVPPTQVLPPGQKWMWEPTTQTWVISAVPL